MAGALATEWHFARVHGIFTTIIMKEFARYGGFKKLVTIGNLSIALFSDFNDFL